MVAGLEVFALVFVVAGLSLEAVSVVAGLSPEVVVLAAEPSLEAVSVAAGLSPEVVVLAAEPEVSEPGVVFVAVVFVAVVSVADVAEPQVSVDIAAVFVALLSAADVAEPLAFVDIEPAFAVLAPVSVVVVEVDSSGRPKFFAFPNICSFPNCSSSVEVVGEESVHSSTGARTNYGLCSILSNLGLHQNRNWERCYSDPSPDRDTVSETNDLPMDATSNHSRKTSPHLSPEQRTHCSFQASRSHPEVHEIRWGAAEKFQY